MNTDIEICLDIEDPSLDPPFSIGMIMYGTISNGVINLLNKHLVTIMDSTAAFNFWGSFTPSNDYIEYFKNLYHLENVFVELTLYDSNSCEIVNAIMKY